MFYILIFSNEFGFILEASLFLFCTLIWMVGRKGAFLSKIITFITAKSKCNILNFQVEWNLLNLKMVYFAIGFGWLVEKGNFDQNYPMASFHSLSFKQNGSHFCLRLLRPSSKFCAKVWKIFWTQPVRVGPNLLLFHLIHEWNLLPSVNISVTQNGLTMY